MEGKGRFFNIVLLFILAFLSLTLAALAGYVFVVVPSSKNTPTTVTQTIDTKIPSDSELTELVLYKDKNMFTLKSDVQNPDPTSISVIQASVQLKYLIKAPKKSKIKDPAEKLAIYDGEIKQLIGSYFMARTRDEVMMLDAKEKANKELSKEINDLLNKNEEVYTKIVYDVIFPEWFAT